MDKSGGKTVFELVRGIQEAVKPLGLEIVGFDKDKPNAVSVRFATPPETPKEIKWASFADSQDKSEKA